MTDDGSNSVQGPVTGDVVQAREIHGGVHLGAQVVVPSAVETPRPFGAGTEIIVGDSTYIVQEHLAEEGHSADGWYRRARCMTANGHGWLRQGPGELAAERDLLRTLRGNGFPRVVQFDVAGRTTTLVTTWPTSGSGKPCAGLEAWLGPRHTLDSLRLYRFCGGLAALATTLGRLHGNGVAHRGLTPDGIVVLDNGDLVLRDLGLAARRITRGEHLSVYQAPEQHMRGSGQIGTWTDVHQLAAIAYHVIAGRPADAVAPLPLTSWVSVPHRLSAVLDAALSADPAQRPDIRAFGAGVLAARADLV